VFVALFSNIYLSIFFFFIPFRNLPLHPGRASARVYAWHASPARQIVEHPVFTILTETLKCSVIYFWLRFRLGFFTFFIREIVIRQHYWPLTDDFVRHRIISRLLDRSYAFMPSILNVHPLRKLKPPDTQYRLNHYNKPIFTFDRMHFYEFTHFSLDFCCSRSVLNTLQWREKRMTEYFRNPRVQETVDIPLKSYS
jgi:hypothetical protein